MAIPLTFTMSGSSFGSLDPFMFNTKYETNHFYAVLRMGTAESTSSYYGALASVSVPEHYLMVLLGISMMSVAGLRRWWKE